MEDTERASLEDEAILLPAVTVGSIRWRILKELGFVVPAPATYGYSGLDPMEDTESRLGRAQASAVERLQWARSDGGY